MKGLVEAREGLIDFPRKGVSLLVGKDRLTDNECLLLWLLGVSVGFCLGLVGSDVLGKEELVVRVGKSGKIVSTRLGELVKGDLVVKLAEDKYRITSFGLVQMQKEILPRIKAKISG